MFFLNKCNWHVPRKMSIICGNGKACACVRACVCVCVCAHAHVHVISVAQCCPTLQPHGGCRGLHVPLSMGFSRQEYWSKLSFLIPGDLPNPGIEPASLESPALVGRFLTTVTPGKPAMER